MSPEIQYQDTTSFDPERFAEDAAYALRLVNELAGTLESDYTRKQEFQETLSEIFKGFDNSYASREDFQSLLQDYQRTVVEEREHCSHHDIVDAINSVQFKVEEVLAGSSTGLADEVTRATGAETALGGRIDTEAGRITAEVTRATGAETALGGRIDTEAGRITAEVTRATGAETALGGRIDTEAGRIDAEITRATGAETALGGRIDAEAARSRAGTLAIPAGATTIAVTFATPFANTAYAVNAQLENTVDVGPAVHPSMIIAKAATGFTVAWATGTATANYVLNYIAVANR